MNYDVKWLPFGDESHTMERAKVLQEMYDVGEPENPHNMPEA